MNQSLLYELNQVMPDSIETGLFSSLFTAQAPDGAQLAGGAPSGIYGNVAGLVNIPCMAPPPSTARVQATEVKALTEITSSELHHVLLDDWYPALDAGWRGDDVSGTGGWRCVIDGTVYDILGVESDSQSQMTRVSV